MAASDAEVNLGHGLTLTSGIYQLLLQRRMLDVTITCGGEAIMAHKAVLVSFSKFLDTVFSGQGDDCDVLNMDNLGLEFEAIRAVIFYMYKGVVDTERCGEEAFVHAAKVLCVDTTPKQLKIEATPEPVPSPPPKPAPPPKEVLKIVEAAKPLMCSKFTQADDPKYDQKSQMTMTDQPRVLKLSRDVQTDAIVTGVTSEVEPDRKGRRIRAIETQTPLPRSQATQETQTVPPLLWDLGLNTEVGRVVNTTTKTKAVINPSLPWQRQDDDDAEDEEDEEDEENDDAGMDTEDDPDFSVANKSTSSQVTPRTSQRKRKPKKLDGEDVETPSMKRARKETPSDKQKVNDGTPTAKRGRGRPRKNPVPETPPTPTPAPSRTPTTPGAKRGRGRPRKHSPPDSKESTPSTSKVKANQEKPSTSSTPGTGPKKRGRGRPRLQDRREEKESPEKNRDEDQNEDDDDKEAEEEEEEEEEGEVKVKMEDDTLYTPKGQRSLRIKPLFSTGRTPRTPSELHFEPKKSMWKKDEAGWFQCLHCDWRRDTSKSLLLHLRIHLGERPYICETCGKSFRTTYKLKDHIRIHTGEKPFLCHECTRYFRTTKALARHKITHIEDKCHLCEECGKAFRSKDRLNCHVDLIHRHIKRYHCSVRDCQFRSSDKKTLVYHQAEIHGHAVPANYVTICDFCGNSVRKSSIRMHMLIHTAKTLQCEHCMFKTQYKNTLNGHMQRLHGLNIDGTIAVKPYGCAVCKERFFTRQQLRYHDMRHKGIKPHKCPICNFATVDKGSMNMHIRTHTGATPYKCPRCNRSFKQSSALSWHIKTVHDGLRRFRCEECNKDYVNKKDLRAHRFSKHLRVKPFSCSLCDYCCTKKEYLAQHIEKSHGSEFVTQDLLPKRTFKRTKYPVITVSPQVVTSQQRSNLNSVTGQYLTMTPDGRIVMETEETNNQETEETSQETDETDNQEMQETDNQQMQETDNQETEEPLTQDYSDIVKDEEVVMETEDPHTVVIMPAVPVAVSDTYVETEAYEETGTKYEIVTGESGNVQWQEIQEPL